jgi:Integrase core domain
MRSRLRSSHHVAWAWLSASTVTFYSLAVGAFWGSRPDRIGSYGASFDRLVRSLGITQIWTPVKAPRANAIAERWVRTIPAACLDPRLVPGDQHLQRLIDEYVAYYEDWRPHRSQDQRAPRRGRLGGLESGNRIVAGPVPGGLHHVYRFVATEKTNKVNADDHLVWNGMGIRHVIVTPDLRN